MNNSQDLLFSLEAALAGRARVLFESNVGSTNTYLKDLARADALSGPTLLFCGWQTAGRGTRGRNWLQPPPAEPGHLRDIALSFAVRLDPAVLRDPRLSLAVGLIAAQALMTVAGPALKVYTKWPNDLLLQSGEGLRKAGGILLETTLGWLVAGIGINVNSRLAQFPAELQPRVGTLRDAMSGMGANGEIELMPLLKSLAVALVQQLHDGIDLAGMHAGWMQLDRSVGQHYRLLRDGTAVEVTACGVTPGGLLTCRAADGTLYEVQSYTELE